MSEAIAFKTIYLPTNQGHGNARRASLSGCSHNLVALMDADDLSVKERFRLQLDLFAADEKLDIVGGQINEFIGQRNNVIATRVVPETDAEIRSFMKKRCPMNQVSVMFKKDAVERVGGYIDWYCEEDYYLWVRMAQGGCKFANVPENLVDVRVGDEMSARRGGLRYFKSEERLQRYILKNKIVSFPQYAYNTAIRFAGEVVIPTKLRTKLFKLFRSIPSEQSLEGKAASETTQEKKEENGKAYPSFSVSMCVYGKDNPDWFDEALNSIVHQTVKPSEIVLTVDGPIPDVLQNVIDKYKAICLKKDA